MPFIGIFAIVKFLNFIIEKNFISLSVPSNVRLKLWRVEMGWGVGCGRVAVYSEVPCPKEGRRFLYNEVPMHRIM